MRNRRMWVTVPPEIRDRCVAFAAQHEMDPSLVVQLAVGKMADRVPTKKDIRYRHGQTVGLQLSFSDLTGNLLDLWSEKTGLKKSLLITYALQETVWKNGSLEDGPENEEERKEIDYE